MLLSCPLSRSAQLQLASALTLFARTAHLQGAQDGCRAADTSGMRTVKKRLKSCRKGKRQANHEHAC
jgi:hypothetical protein